MAYSIGNVGNIGSTSAVYSDPVIIDSSACFALSNGVKKMLAVEKGMFTSNCTVTLNNALEIKLIGYPNPVVNNLLLKTSDNILYFNTTNVHLELLDMAGRFIHAYTTDINTLNLGYNINLTDIATGIYVIKVVIGDAKTQFIKIIKS
jgi:uncharacterized protein YjdB